ncbi:unnamed protein product [Callosobruchus maculatus]|uniref:DEP domain-containing protein n=1 Tax=Callosobruchus maculatus TaxID=64391 RepID=A0A653CDP7_CALMS|nr:unnamed protein product [Callosobruchus maculatus]
MEQMSGIYVELSFLDATLNFGQSIIVFAIFGLNSKEIVLPILKYWRKLWYGANTLSLPAWHELSPETKHVCDQFVTHHLQRCRETIATDRRWRLKIYKNVFTGEQFVDWLIEVGLARDRIEAVNYARHLVEGTRLVINKLGTRDATTSYSSASVRDRSGGVRSGYIVFSLLPVYLIDYLHSASNTLIFGIPE